MERNLIEEPLVSQLSLGPSLHLKDELYLEVLCDDVSQNEQRKSHQRKSQKKN